MTFGDIGLSRREVAIMTTDDMRRVLARMAHEIIERSRGRRDFFFIGVISRGQHIARRLARNILDFEGWEPKVGSVEPLLYRDDSGNDFVRPVRPTSVPFDVMGNRIILVDDVIYTGRTARASMEALFAFGRPSGVWLAVLIDRGHRELPIRPDFVGKNLPTAHSESVRVRVSEDTGRDFVSIIKRDVDGE